MRNAPKYLLSALALAALATAGAAPLLAQSVHKQDGTTTDGDFAVSVRSGHLDNCPADDNPKGQPASHSPPDH